MQLTYKTHTTLVHLMLWAIVALAAYLRLQGMSRSLWIDEILSYQLAIQPLSAIFGQVSYPLSYVLLHYALQLGDAEALIRLPSYIAGVFAVWLIYFTGRACHSRHAGIVASLLLAISSIHIYYSQEARFYSLMPLAAVVVIWTLTRAIQRPGRLRYWIGFSAGAAVGSVSHTFFLPFLAAVSAGAGIAVLFRRRGWSGRRKLLLKLMVFVVLGLLPLAACYLHLRQVHPLALVTGDQAATSFRLTVHDYIGFLRRILHYQAPERSLVALLLSGAGWVVFAIRCRWRALVVLAPFLLMPLPLLFIPVSHWYNEKYFITLLPGGIICLAVLLVEVSRWLTRPMRRFVPRRDIHPAVLAALVLLVTTQYAARNLYGWHWRPPWAAFAGDMAAHMTGADVVLHYAPMPPSTEGYDPRPDSLDFYLQRQVAAGLADSYPTRHIVTDSPAELDRQLSRYRRSNVWLIRWTGDGMIPLTPAQGAAFRPRVYRYWHQLMVAPAPTRNLVVSGAADAVSTGVETRGTVQVVRFDTPTRPGRWSGRTSGTSLLLTATADLPSPSVCFAVDADTTDTDTTTRNQTALRQDQDYVLSVRLKYSDATGNYRTTGSLRLALRATPAGRTSITIPLDHFHGISDWTFLSYRLTPELYPQLFSATSLVLELAITGPQGRAWIDNVQLEPGTRPRPFQPH